MTNVAESRIHELLADVTYSTKFRVTGGDGSQLHYAFETIEGNKPNTCGNTLFIWDADDLVVPPTTPMGAKGIESSSNKGNERWQIDTQSKDYVLGYAVGPEVNNVCALVLIDKDKKQTGQFYPSLQVTYRATDYVSFNYSLPKGSKPMTSGDWFGLWKGDEEQILYTQPPLKIGTPTGDSHEGSATVQYRFPTATKFTIGYFKGGYAGQPKQTTLCCAYTFTSP